MKTSDHKTTSRSRSQQLDQQPFFRKEGDGFLFSEVQPDIQPFFNPNSSEESAPFFTPPSIQAKLAIGQPGDKYEQEADDKADQVVQAISKPEVPVGNVPHSGAASLQPELEETPEEEGMEKEEEVRLMPVFENGGGPPEDTLPRKYAACEQRKEGITTKLQQGGRGLKPSLQKADEPSPAGRPLRERIQEAVINEMKERRGGEAAESWELASLEGPRKMANPEPGLGPNQVRYQAAFKDYKEDTIEISVNYDPDTGLFGIIKFASGRER